MSLRLFLSSVLLAPCAAILSLSANQAPRPAAAPLALPQERHLKNMKQLTSSGENAEAYFSFDGKRLSFQSTQGHKCDQIYTMKIDGTDRKLVSTGKGRTTCSFYYPDGKSIIYASTHLANDVCPTPPDMSQGYVWGWDPLESTCRHASLSIL